LRQSDVFFAASGIDVKKPPGKQQKRGKQQRGNLAKALYAQQFHKKITSCLR
jgi:hypothetical protein